MGGVGLGYKKSYAVVCIYRDTWHKVSVLGRKMLLQQLVGLVFFLHAFHFRAGSAMGHVSLISPSSS